MKVIKRLVAEQAPEHTVAELPDVVSHQPLGRFGLMGENSFNHLPVFGGTFDNAAVGGLVINGNVMHPVTGLKDQLAEETIGAKVTEDFVEGCIRF